MAAAQILQMARELVLHPDSWTTGYEARSLSGWPVSLESNSAVKFSMLGAIRRSELSQEGHDPAALVAVANVIGRRFGFARIANEACVDIGSVIIMMFNEITYHRQVVGVFDDAIAELQNQHT
jgi:hypothetical protein